MYSKGTFEDTCTWSAALNKKFTPKNNDHVL